MNVIRCKDFDPTKVSFEASSQEGGEAIRVIKYGETSVNSVEHNDKHNHPLFIETSGVVLGESRVLATIAMAGIASIVAKKGPNGGASELSDVFSRLDDLVGANGGAHETIGLGGVPTTEDMKHKRAGAWSSRQGGMLCRASLCGGRSQRFIKSHKWGKLLLAQAANALQVGSTVRLLLHLRGVVTLGGESSLRIDLLKVFDEFGYTPIYNGLAPVAFRTANVTTIPTPGHLDDYPSPRGFELILNAFIAPIDDNAEELCKGVLRRVMAIRLLGGEIIYLKRVLGYRDHGESEVKDIIKGVSDATVGLDDVIVKLWAIKQEDFLIFDGCEDIGVDFDFAPRFLEDRLLEAHGS